MEISKRKSRVFSADFSIRAGKQPSATEALTRLVGYPN